ncbi:hypothetical protein LY90DRAFT_518649 [Neocallimastix californiae]|uniref:Uncharacterized protein n=1 Tax=Neocallimastix californiae TaxID=1754190 RepID=A0A1Y1ZKJ0_9FUNG|nr:hypothetical protein LY90DRAFT_518649 [Neocallimastix californiae]|eukprot:ORY10704.1 hypothetical protein LY90DRAFT_518649 [Neocallimastix californiae]
MNKMLFKMESCISPNCISPGCISTSGVVLKCCISPSCISPSCFSPGCISTSRFGEMQLGELQFDEMPHTHIFILLPSWFRWRGPRTYLNLPKKKYMDAHTIFPNRTLIGCVRNDYFSLNFCSTMISYTSSST